ncbi:MAG: endonuclease/exonuclease/phosphatase family protein [Acidobacteriota bacterium]
MSLNRKMTRAPIWWIVALSLVVAWPVVAASSRSDVEADPQVVGAAESPLRRPTSQVEPLNVMTFNIRYGTANDGDNDWSLRREAVFEVIEAFRVDVLGVQEALNSQLAEISAALPGYRRIGVGRDDGAEAGEYSAILVDSSRFEVLDEGTFWFSDTPDVPGSTSWGNEIPRICTFAHLRDGPANRTFWVFNVHWDHVSQPSRERAAELLMATIGERAAGEPVLITGDFNAGEDNPAFRYLLDSEGALALGMFDTFRDVHPDATDVGTFNGFEGNTDGDKIDAILASSGWAVLAADIIRTRRQGRYPSDHFPVIATLALR